MAEGGLAQGEVCEEEEQRSSPRRGSAGLLFRGKTCQDGVMGPKQSRGSTDAWHGGTGGWRGGCHTQGPKAGTSQKAHPP